MLWLRPMIKFMVFLPVSSLQSPLLVVPPEMLITTNILLKPYKTQRQSAPSLWKL